MPRFAANLSFLYQELPFLDRFDAAAADGFEGVEFLFPYEHAPADVAQRLRRSGLQQVMFNMPPGDWARGERGIAALPGREEEFRAGLEKALVYAAALGCRRLHAMSGLVAPGADRARHRAVLVRNLREAAERLAALDMTLLIEPINSRDMPGYFLNSQDEAHGLVSEVGLPNLKVQMDLYHCQIMEGDLTRRIERGLPQIGHIQIAGVPDRHEPDDGEVNYGYLFARLDELAYAGWVGCEYRPRTGTSEGLAWLRRSRAPSRVAEH